jgi:hypothetical protein
VQYTHLSFNNDENSVPETIDFPFLVLVLSFFKRSVSSRLTSSNSSSSSSHTAGGGVTLSYTHTHTHTHTHNCHIKTNEINYCHIYMHYSSLLFYNNAVHTHTHARTYIHTHMPHICTQCNPTTTATHSNKTNYTILHYTTHNLTSLLPHPLTPSLTLSTFFFAPAPVSRDSAKISFPNTSSSSFFSSSHAAHHITHNHHHTQSHTHSLTHSLTHTLTHSLTLTPSLLRSSSVHCTSVC